jgi:hypothetical protein
MWRGRHHDLLGDHEGAGWNQRPVREHVRLGGGDQGFVSSFAGVGVSFSLAFRFRCASMIALAMSRADMSPAK